MREINSAKNEHIKELKKLAKKKYRDETGTYLIEGWHLLEEAGDAVIEVLSTDPERATTLVTKEVLVSLSDLPSTPEVVAVVRKSKPEKPDFNFGRYIALDNVQDPGNVGTIVRNADAFGFRGVLIGAGTADIYSPKVMRSMQGSNFHLPIFTDVDLVELAKNHRVIATALDETARRPENFRIEENTIVVLGNEGQGVSPELLELAQDKLYIPMTGNAESLNVGVASGIIMYILRR
ncbi:MAG: RNA methyltransferase [Lactobacillales bacterium]|jgi:TrmH family RNA methyltransferase|nr:RNA methyltransferase [Lactobacillales bacterium]